MPQGNIPSFLLPANVVQKGEVATNGEHTGEEKWVCLGFLMDRLARGSDSVRGRRIEGNLGRTPNPWDYIHPVPSRTYLIVPEMYYHFLHVPKLTLSQLWDFPYHCPVLTQNSNDFSHFLRNSHRDVLEIGKRFLKTTFTVANLKGDWITSKHAAPSVCLEATWALDKLENKNCFQALIFQIKSLLLGHSFSCAFLVINP